jgi:hypothetical protein
MCLSFKFATAIEVIVAFPAEPRETLSRLVVWILLNCVTEAMVDLEGLGGIGYVGSGPIGATRGWGSYLGGIHIAGDPGCGI